MVGLVAGAMTQSFRVTASIKKTADEGDVVRMYGWAALSKDDLGEPVIDSDSEYIPAYELEKAAQRAFISRGGMGAVGVMHVQQNLANLVESFVVTEDKRDAFGLGATPLGWMVGLESRDPTVIKRVRTGELLELSIRGRGAREYVDVRRDQARQILKRDVAKLATNDGAADTVRVGIVRDLELAEFELLSLVDRGASANERVRPRIVLVKRHLEETKKMPVVKRAAYAILAELFEQGKLSDLSPEDKESLMVSIGMQPAAPEKPAEPEPKPEVMSADAPQTDMPKAADEPGAPAPAAPAGDVGKKDKGETDPKVSELLKRNVELHDRVVKLEREAKRGEVIKMVASDMAYFPGASIDELADVVQSAQENLGQQMADRVVKMLKAASATCAKSDLLKAVGLRKSDGDSADDPNGQLMELAKSLQKTDPKLSSHEALVKAGRQRPDLWASRATGKARG